MLRAPIIIAMNDKINRKGVEGVTLFLAGLLLLHISGMEKGKPQISVTTVASEPIFEYDIPSIQRNNGNHRTVCSVLTSDYHFLTVLPTIFATF